MKVRTQRKLSGYRQPLQHGHNRHCPQSRKASGTARGTGPIPQMRSRISSGILSPGETAFNESDLECSNPPVPDTRTGAGTPIITSTQNNGLRGSNSESRTPYKSNEKPLRANERIQEIKARHRKRFRARRNNKETKTGRSPVSSGPLKSRKLSHGSDFQKC